MDGKTIKIGSYETYISKERWILCKMICLILAVAIICTVFSVVASASRNKTIEGEHRIEENVSAFIKEYGTLDTAEGNIIVMFTDNENSGLDEGIQ